MPTQEADHMGSYCGGHPRTRHTHELLKEKYWSKEMLSDINKYVSSCSSCAQAKVPHHFPAGKLHPLPNPQCPWSHLALVFLTDFPESEGNTVILVVLHCFSRYFCLLLLPKLPASFELAGILFSHVFCYFGLPEDIFSDRGPQFTFQVWASFLKKDRGHS